MECLLETITAIVSPDFTLCLEQKPSIQEVRNPSWSGRTRVNCQSRAPGLRFSARIHCGTDVPLVCPLAGTAGWARQKHRKNRLRARVRALGGLTWSGHLNRCRPLRMKKPLMTPSSAPGFILVIIADSADRLQGKSNTITWAGSSASSRNDGSPLTAAPSLVLRTWPPNRTEPRTTWIHAYRAGSSE
jgi:hypothetical protein